MGSGSGVCVSRDGFFITNHHVVAAAGLGQEVRLVLDSGQKTQRVLEARVVKIDEENDLALLKATAPPDLVAIPLGTDEQLVETMPLVAFGYPFGRMLAADKGYPAVSVNTGTITALRRKAGELSKIQLDASVNPGNSGGPVVDKDGKLIGIVESGMVMARLNFAIPVSRVREFLSGPALVLREPRLTFSGRTTPHRFEIDAYAFDRRLLDDLSVELALTDSVNDTRTLEAKRIGERFVAEGPACPPGSLAPRPVLVVHKGRGRIHSELPPGELSLGSRRFPWADIDSLTRDGDEWVVSLLDGGRLAGKAIGLPSVRFGVGRATRLATADRIEVRLNETPPTEVAYEIRAHRGRTVFTPIQGRIRIRGTPRGMTPSFDQPISRTEIRQPIVIEAVVPETLMLAAGPNGLAWVPQPGTPPGMESDRGRHILVNGQPWYIEQPDHRRPEQIGGNASILPMHLGVREGQIRLLWARQESDGPHDAGRVAADVQKNAEAGVLTVTVKNKAPQPTRIALAIDFHLPVDFVPLLPPRSQSVAESHWPLNDEDSTRAADLGPRKHTGRTSAASVAPGIRGNGLQIDRQNILFPGVLPIDRTDSFSCSAWIKPARAGNLTAFSRMNNGLRGFDLNYSGTLEAHLISSWDGNAIRVGTIERFDSTQWHHVVVTYDGSSRSRGLKIYLDGAEATLEVTVDRLSETIRCDFPFAIGGRERRDYYQGRVDEVRAYDRALSPDEVFELYDLDRSTLDPAAGSTLNQGLVAYWPFDGSLAESFADRSGHGHHGHPEADPGLPQIADSDGGQVIRFAGSGTLDCGAMADFERDEPYSLGAWFKSRSNGAQAVMGTLDRQDRGYDFLLMEGRLYAHLVSQWEGNALRIVSRSTYPIETWHHVVCTYDGSSRGAGLRLYVDGVESPCDISHDSLRSSTKSHSYFRIGSRNDRAYFDGDLDDVFVYGRALSAGEARGWFEQGTELASPALGGAETGAAGVLDLRGKGGGGLSGSERERPSRPARPPIRALGDRPSGPDAGGAVSRHRRHRLRAGRRLRAHGCVLRGRLVLLGRGLDADLDVEDAVRPTEPRVRH